MVCWNVDYDEYSLLKAKAYEAEERIAALEKQVAELMQIITDIRDNSPAMEE